MDKESKIYIAGNTGMVGSAIARNLISQGFTNHVYSPFLYFDLTNQKTVGDFFEREKPEYVFLAAAKVGGIMSNNTYRAQFLYENLMIQNNIIHQSYLNNVKKVLFLGSSCIYPRNCPQPIKEEYLLTDKLEYTNEPYAIAKIAGIKMCESYNIQYGTNFVSVMPTNLYGPNDNYNLETSHVLPAMIRKMHLGKCLENNDWGGIRKDLQKHPIDGLKDDASDTQILVALSRYGIKYITREQGTGKQKPVTITLWGTGSPFREFMYVDDLAEACIYLMNYVDYEDLKAYNGLQKEIKNTHINIGTGEDITIKDLADLIRQVVGFNGQLVWDHSKPDGTFRKLLDVNRLNRLGWHYRTSLDEGINLLYRNYSS